MATIVLTALGTAIGGPLGAAIGGLIGNSLDQAVLFKPKGVEGRRLADLQVQTSTYGAQMPKIFGKMRVAGTVIWATDLKEKRKKSGGGKGRPSVTSYSYSSSFAVALSTRKIKAVRRIWADGNLLRGAAGDFKSERGAFRVYLGGEAQAVDPLIASAQGLAHTPAHRGIAYVVFEDLQLADFGNRIPSLTFEVEADDGAVGIDFIARDLCGDLLSVGVLGEVDGFAAGGTDVADAIMPLAQAHDLAFIDGAGGMRLAGTIAEEGAEEAELRKAGLCQRVNGRKLDPAERSGAAAEGVPVALSLRHYDAERDYQAGVQRISRPGPGRVEQGIDLPAVLSGGAARFLSARRLAHAWAGRSTIMLRCGWDALRYDAGDVVLVEGASGRWRIEEREWEAMAVRLTLRRVPGGESLLPPGVSSGTVMRQEDAPHGPTTLMLADLPSIRDGLATSPVIVAAASGGAGWRGAALFAMSPTGEATPVGRTAPAAVMGKVDELLPPGSAAMIDERNSLHVTLLAAEWELGDADEAALSLGRNLALAGRELIQFSRAVQTGPLSFRLDGLRRGLCGTEWAMEGHEADEPFLLVEEDRLVEPFATQSGIETGAALRLAAIGVGDAEPFETELTVSGEALVPPSPVHAGAVPDGAGGWAVTWTRRSRTGWRWLSGSDVPLAEESERYEVRVLDGATLIRRVEMAVPAWTYDAAMIAADGGGDVTVEIRQIGSFAMGRAARLPLSL